MAVFLLFLVCISILLATVPDSLSNAFSATAFHHHHQSRSSSRTNQNLLKNRAVEEDLQIDHNRHSSRDWWYNIRSFPESQVLREVRNPVLAVAAWSLCVSAVYKVCLRASNYKILQTIATSMSISSTAHSFLVSALGLLLVFRTNSAYQRFYVRPYS